MKSSPLIFAASLFIPFAFQSAHAAGLLDWADPCVDAEKTFNSNSAAIRSRADQAIREWDGRVEPPGELRGLYVEAIREGAYKAWSDDPGTKAILDAMKAKDPQFNAHALFISQVYPKVVAPEKEAEYVRLVYKADYDGKIRPKLVESRDGLEKTINSEKQKLDSSCKPDVVSHVLRGTIGNALAILGNNWSAAQNEKGDLAKYFRATSGISITDIQKYGIQGGPNSELNKLLGGEGGVARQVIKTLDPSQWKIEFDSQFAESSFAKYPAAQYSTPQD
jgi:hypothetical protein